MVGGAKMERETKDVGVDDVPDVDESCSYVFCSHERDRYGDAN